MNEKQPGATPSTTREGRVQQDLPQALCFSLAVLIGHSLLGSRQSVSQPRNQTCNSVQNGFFLSFSTPKPLLVPVLILNYCRWSCTLSPSHPAAPPATLPSPHGREPRRPPARPNYAVIRRSLLRWGHRPILSTQPSLRVCRLLNVLQNCQITPDHTRLWTDGRLGTKTKRFAKKDEFIQWRRTEVEGPTDGLNPPKRGPIDWQP